MILSPKFHQKLASLKKDGLSTVRIVSDFDRTLTRAYVDGQPSSTSFSVLAASGLLSKNFVHVCNELVKTYYPIEMSYDLDPNLKMQKMDEWWLKSFQAVLDEQVSLDTIAAVAQHKTMAWRPKAEELFHLSLQHQLPIYVFSAGLGDVIKAYLLHHQALHELVNIVSNFLQYNSTGVACGYYQPFFRSDNKNESILHQQSRTKPQNLRKNVILLGDQLGDATMCQENNCSCILRIGFYNEPTNQNLERYQAVFDAVIPGDASMAKVVQLINDLA